MRSIDYILNPDEHANKIKAHFNGRVCYDADTPLFDKPMVILAFTNRCGSNLFASHLRNTRVIGGLFEATNQEEVTEENKNTDCNSYDSFFRLKAEQIIDTGRFYGIKASAQQIAMLYRWNIPAMFPGTVVFHVQRRNLVEQAVSMTIASQTGKWSSATKGTQQEAQFKFPDVAFYLERIAQQNVAIQLLVEVMELPSKTFYYEEFTGEPLPYIRDALALLGHDIEITSMPEPQIQKQANARNEAFKIAFQTQIRRAVSQD